MAIARTMVTQASADNFTAVPITLPALDGKSGYQINGIRAHWIDGFSVAAADYSVIASVQTTDSSVTLLDQEWIDGVAWGCQNTAGVAVALMYEPAKEHFLAEPRVTVQPVLYASLETFQTAAANAVVLELAYEVIKLSEIEYLRLLAAGR